MHTWDLRTVNTTVKYFFNKFVTHKGAILIRYPKKSLGILECEFEGQSFENIMIGISERQRQRQKMHGFDHQASPKFRKVGVMNLRHSKNIRSICKKN